MIFYQNLRIFEVSVKIFYEYPKKNKNEVNLLLKIKLYHIGMGEGFFKGLKSFENPIVYITIIYFIFWQ